MRKTTQTASQPQNESVTIAFQDFNGVFLAKISNLKDKETFAYGETKESAQANAVKNYSIKYAINNFPVFNN